MRKSCLSSILLTLLAFGAAPASAQEPVQQVPPAPVLWCGQQIPAPAKLPPAGSGPVVYLVGVCFPAQGGVSVIEPNTYLFYIQQKPSMPSQDVWMPYDPGAQETILGDFKRLWGTNFLDNLSIEVTDYPFANGVVGKLVAYNMEERQRVKIVDYVGTKKLEQTKIDEKLKELNAQIRLDSFLDPAMIKRVKNVIMEMLAEKGHQYAVVTPQIKAVAGGPKLVNLTFQIDEGPQVKIRKLDFDGNKAFGDSKLGRQFKNNKGTWMFSFITGRGTYQEAKFEEDADKLVGYYRDHGYIAVRVGEPELKVIEDSTDRRTRWVTLRVPIVEGERYKVGDFTFDGNTVVKSEGLRSLFKLKSSDWYSDKAVRKGLEKAREVYGAAGYFEFNGYPDLTPREGQPQPGQPPKQPGQPGQPPAPDPATADGDGHATADGQAAGAPAAAKPSPAAPAGPKPTRIAGAPVVDVTMRMQEGKQYFINRIIFTGNTTTRDTVVRREMRLFENGVFNTEALKYSIKRINQLAYFKAIEGGKDVNVEKTPGTDNKVDVTLKFEEQNRNQLTFGAGVSQYEGFFGQLSFQTANFMGRGETFTVSLQAGSRAQNYQVAFTEPYLFDRAITGGIDIYKRELRYLYQFTQSSVGGNLIFGFPVRDFTRLFLNYSYEQTRVKDLNPLYTDPAAIQGNPFLADMLLLGQGGSRTVSKIVPSLVHNTIDNPIFPTSGRRYSLSMDLAGLGGDTNFFKPMVEGIWYIPHTRRTSFGVRGQFAYIKQFTGSLPLPIFERLYLGGEYSIRGFDLRTVGPKAPDIITPPLFLGQPLLPELMPGVQSLDPTVTPSLLVIGGNKSLLFNAEYLISIAGPVRLVLFYDAGQALDKGQNFALNEFKTSTGAEIRFFMPVLNVPFRLIFAYNPQRDGVFDNNLQPAKKFVFRFAVGSTF